METYSKIAFESCKAWKSKLGSFCELPAWWKCTQRPLLTKLGAFEIWNMCSCQKFVLKHCCRQTIFLKDCSRKCVSTFLYKFYILHFATSICEDWTFQVPKKSKNILFYKPSEHKKCNFWTIHNQSWQLRCCIIDWNNKIYSQIGALKSPKRPKAFFSTSPVATRNAAFESSNANLGNLNVS